MAKSSLRIAPESLAFTVLLGVLAALPALSIDISTPTMLLIQRALDTSSTVAGLTLSVFMGGFALGQLGGGQLSDLSGRRPILLVGLIGYTLASVACAMSPTGLVLLSSRFVQGIGAGTCSVLSFAMVQDLFEGDTARAKRSYVTVIFGIVPILAPALGSVLSNLAGWRVIYGILALVGGSLLVVVWHGIAESKRTKLAVSAQTGPNGGGRLWDDLQFVRLASANALSYGAIFAYIAGSPVIIIDQMRRSSTVFAAIFACTAMALTAGAWTSGRLSRRGLTAATILGPALGIAAFASFALAAASAAGITSGAILIPLLLIILYARGATAPNLQHLAIERRSNQAGVASAAVGVSQLLSGAAASAVVALLLPNFGIRAVAIPMALLASGALGLWHWISRA